MPRQKFPNRRDSRLFDFHFKGIDWKISYSRLPDGRVGEIFLHGGKSGSDVDALRYSIGVILSHLLQHGADIKDILPSLPRLPNGHHAEIIGAILREIEKLADE